MRFTKQLKYAVVLIIMPVLLGGCHLKGAGNQWHGSVGYGCKLIKTTAERAIITYTKNMDIDEDDCLLIENRLVLERDTRSVQEIADERVAEGADKRNLLGQAAVTYYYKKDSDSYDETDNSSTETANSSTETANSSTETANTTGPPNADEPGQTKKVNTPGFSSGVALPGMCVSNCQVKVCYGGAVCAD